MGMKRKEYDEALEPLTHELVSMARWAKASGARIAVLFEGRDTAGKGGAISAVRGELNPRQCRTVALSKPSEAEQTQWYFQRYVPHLPAAGEICSAMMFQPVLSTEPPTTPITGLSNTVPNSITFITINHFTAKTDFVVSSPPWKT